QISGLYLQLIVGVFLLWVAYKMFFGGKKQVASHSNDVNPELPSKPKQLAAGGVIGVASAIFGIGGGSLTVPYLTRYGVVMQKAVGTSAA
ncbi:sulfite exporter TauE/SafE family protein, partial [Psychrobacter sp. SMN/5/1215-MNA-CIBAN-0208]